MSLILFIDTAAAHTQVALANEHTVLSNVVHEQANEQAKVLNILIETQLESQQLNWSAIDAVTVDAGPGSYTGLRVGLGVAKGLCFALDKPILLFNRLELLAGEETDILMLLKARVGEGFAFARQEGTVLLKPSHVFYEQMEWEDYNGLKCWTDDEQILEQNTQAFAIKNTILDIPIWNKFAQIRMAKKEYDDLAYAEPFYLKSAFTTTSKKKI